MQRLLRRRILIDAADWSGRGANPTTTRHGREKDFFFKTSVHFSDGLGVVVAGVDGGLVPIDLFGGVSGLDGWNYVGMGVDGVSMEQRIG